MSDEYSDIPEDPALAGDNASPELSETEGEQAAEMAADEVVPLAGYDQSSEGRGPAGTPPPPPPPPFQRPRVPENMVPPPAPIYGAEREAGTQGYGGGGRPPGGGKLSGLWVVVTIVGLGLVTMMVGLFLVGQTSDESSGSGGVSLRSGKVGIVSIVGVIQDGGRGGVFMGTPGARSIMEDLRQAKDDNEIKAVVVLVNSPGGSPAASHAIYQEIMRLRKTKKVVACMTDVAASGGYYVSAAADKIVAQQSTMTGSIGVIFGGVGYYGLMDKLGIVDNTQTAGRYKDVGSPMRAKKEYEKELIQSLLDDTYRQFVEAVAEGRQMPLAKVKPLAEGRIYTGAQAHKVGLVDELGNFYDAIKLAGKLGGLTGEPKIKYIGSSRSLWQELMSSESLGGRYWPLSRGRGLPYPALSGPMLVAPWAYPSLLSEGGQLEGYAGY